MKLKQKEHLIHFINTKKLIHQRKNCISLFRNNQSFVIHEYDKLIKKISSKNSKICKAKWKKGERKDCLLQKEYSNKQSVFQSQIKIRRDKVDYCKYGNLNQFSIS